MVSVPVNKPNFFILGAGKSGTTSLHNYLGQHPEIFMSPVKEPTYFSQGYQVITNASDYYTLFDAVRDERIVGESSHVYLTNPSTAAVLAEQFPTAKFLIIVRNPADRAYSLHAHMVRTGLEPIGNFEEALAAEEWRATSEEFARNCPQYLYNYLYFRSGLYGEQIERYLKLFDRRQFYFLTLEQLKLDPTESLRAIFEFLGVTVDFSPSLDVHNEGGVTARFPSLTYAWASQVQRPRSLRRLGLKGLELLNTKAIEPLNPATREALMARYSGDLERYYQLTGIRL